jgi:hypothetical protein
LFGQCDEFDDPKKLKNFTVMYGLVHVKRCIVDSDRFDHDDLMIKLLTVGRSREEPALCDLLGALATRYLKLGDFKGQEFESLKAKVRSALLEPKNSEEEEGKIYQQLMKVSTPSDGQGVEDEAGRWIDEAGDNWDELALRITLAVFHGATFEWIERAKNDLLAMLQELAPPPPPDPEAPPPPPPHVPLMRRIKLAGAYETDGKPPDWKKVIELERPGIASEAISHVWQLYQETRWRQKLIEWLTSYAAGRPAEVRTRAAFAAGILAIKDYRSVRDDLLEPWVHKNNAEYRMAVGVALGVLAREDGWAAEVQGLLWKWSASPKQAEQWAAVRAYIYVGAHCKPVSGVIDRWRYIAASQLIAVIVQVSDTKYLEIKNPMYMSLVDAMMQFFGSVAQQPEEKRRSLFAGILEGLKKWIVADEADARLGLFMFTTLGRLVVGATDNGDSDDAPVLLQLVEEVVGKTEYRSRLAELFGVVMNNGTTVIEAKELLCAWLGWANGLQRNSELYETRLRTVFKDIIADDKSGRIRGRLAACLRDCGRNRTAQSILSSL